MFGIAKGKIIKKIITETKDKDIFDLFIENSFDLFNVEKDTIYLESTTDKIRDDPLYSVGTYILCDKLNNTLQLVKKNEIVNKGYFYNSCQYSIDKLDQLDLCGFDLNMPTNDLFEENNNDTISVVANEKTYEQMDTEYINLFHRVDDKIKIIKQEIDVNNTSDYANKLTMFDPDVISVNSLLSFVGSDTVKSTDDAMNIVDSLTINNMIDNNDIYVVGGTNSVNDQWKHKFAGTNIYNNNLPVILNMSIKQLFSDKLYNYMDYVDNNHFGSNSSTFKQRKKIIVMYIDTLCKKESYFVKDLVANGRLYNFTIILIDNLQTKYVGFKSDKLFNTMNTMNYVFVYDFDSLDKISNYCRHFDSKSCETFLDRYKNGIVIQNTFLIRNKVFCLSL